jgi:tetratricopeptide (TPR) repeat protein
MADPSIVAFGRYLKIVRERRKLSLEDVAHLTKAYPEPVNKGYLSRVERGLNHVGFSKMVALSRAYEIPLDAFGERYALDLEVDRLKSPPDTDNRTFGDLFEEGRRLANTGKRTHSFACLRDALPKAAVDPVISNYGGRSEQIAAACLSHGVAAVALGRYRLGMVEVIAARDARSLRAEFLPIVSHELSIIHRQLGDFRSAKELADQAIKEAQEAPEHRYLAEAYSVRARLAKDDQEYDKAIELYQSAFKVKKEAGRSDESALVLLNLAAVYFEVGRIGATRRTIQAAEKLEHLKPTSSVRPRLRILLGEVEALQGHRDKASAHWHTAITMAKETNDRVAHFNAEFRLFKLAVESGNHAVLNSLGRRLSRMAPWIPTAEPEVEQFHALYSRHRKPKQRGVANPQHGP